MEFAECFNGMVLEGASRETFCGIGAAAGAAGGLVRGASKASELNPVYKNFVNKCLCDKRYEPIGWK